MSKMKSLLKSAALIGAGYAAAKIGQNISGKIESEVGKWIEDHPGGCGRFLVLQHVLDEIEDNSAYEALWKKFLAADLSEKKTLLIKYIEEHSGLTDEELISAKKYIGSSSVDKTIENISSSSDDVKMPPIRFAKKMLRVEKGGTNAIEWGDNYYFKREIIMGFAREVGIDIELIYALVITTYPLNPK